MGLGEHADDFEHVLEATVPGMSTGIPAVKEAARRDIQAQAARGDVQAARRHVQVNLIQENPTLAVPVVAAAVSSGDLNLDDYDIPTDAKEDIMGLATAFSKVDNGDSQATQLAQVATGLEA